VPARRLRRPLRERRHELDKLTIGHDRLRYYLPRRTTAPEAEAPPARRRIGFIGFPLRYYPLWRSPRCSATLR
jgi:hypothetical protein